MNVAMNISHSGAKHAYSGNSRYAVEPASLNDHTDRTGSKIGSKKEPSELANAQCSTTCHKVVSSEFAICACRIRFSISLASLRDVSNSFQFIPIHSNSFQFIPIHQTHQIHHIHRSFGDVLFFRHQRLVFDKPFASLLPRASGPTQSTNWNRG